MTLVISSSETRGLASQSGASTAEPIGTAADSHENHEQLHEPCISEGYWEEYKKNYRTDFWGSLEPVCRQLLRIAASNCIRPFRELKARYRELTYKPAPLPPYSILELRLGVRSTVMLLRAGINTLPELLQWTEQQLTRKIGKTPVKEIKQVLAERDLQLGMDPSQIVLLFPRREPLK